MIRPKKKLVLENGQEFYGVGFGAYCDRVCELIFNTSVVGYQEILSDPSYSGQIVVMTYPLIGNYGITDEDFEARTAAIGGLVVRECCDTPSNFRFTKTLEEELEERGIPCISGVDTRRLTRVIRSSKRMMAAIVNAEMPTKDALKLIKSTPRETGLVAKVSCKKRWLARTPNHKFNVVAVDCGIKFSIVKLLTERGCNVTVVPFNTAAKDIEAFNPDGILFSNGPGSPDEVPGVKALLEELKGKYPIFGIGLSHELIGLSYGAKLENLGCGLHGDHPVRDLSNNKINVGVMNQTYAFKSISGTALTATHVSVPEGYVEGFECTKDRIFSVQFHAEAAPGPQDNIQIFDKFISMMEGNGNA